MKLIDADKIPYHKQLEAQGNGQYEEVEVAYKSEIDAVPTVDAVEIVRCKDCKYSRIANPIMCVNGKGLAVIGTESYCSYGERKGK